MKGNSSILKDRPWAFSASELTAGLRRYLNDPKVQITQMNARDIPHQRSSVSRIHGLQVTVTGSSGSQTLDLVVKQSLTNAHAGTTSSGLRERSLYSNLRDYIPIKMPDLVAADPEGEWLVLRLLPGGKPVEKWQAADYLLAMDQLALLHERFWGLAEDLYTYNWLGRPLDTDFNILVAGAKTGLLRLRSANAANTLAQDKDLLQLFTTLVDQAHEIAEPLRQIPGTLLHGDYWPGNLLIYPENTLYAIDWQQTAIGPAILDAVVFIQESRWHLDPLPVSAIDLQKRYQQQFSAACSIQWDNATWSLYWDHALLWVFLIDWLDLLGNTPEAIIQTHRAQLQKVWFQPVLATANRRLAKTN